MAKSLSNDRSGFQVLVVCNRGNTSTQLRHALKALGFTQISTAPTHNTALDRLRTRPFSHIIFDAADTDIPALEFVTRVAEEDAETVMVAVSDQPRIDDVFGLLKAGARSFLVPPFTVDMIEEILIQATDGARLSDAVLNAPDRNAAFVAVILNNLYRLSVAMRQAREFTSAERDVKAYNFGLRESVEMSQLFGEGDDDDLRDKIVDACIARAKDASSRLGRLRKKLKKERKDEDDVPAAA